MSILDHIVEIPNAQRALLRALSQADKPVLIFGAGVYAYVLRRFLAANGIEISRVMVDAAYATEPPFIGLPVITLQDQPELLAGCHVVVGITNYPPIVDRLRRLGGTAIHVIDIPDYLNMPYPFMDKAFIQENEAEFSRAAVLFADDLSRQTFVAAINTKINEDLSFIRPYVVLDNLYFPTTEFALGDDEILLDVGGFNGDTVREFHRMTQGRYSSIISLEPGQENFTQLVATIDELRLSNVTALNIGAWDRHAYLGLATREMHIDNQVVAQGEHTIEVDTIDAILDRDARHVTLMKLDINGAEYPALSGARETIRKHRPQIAVRLHKKEDFYRLPILLHEIAPDMRLYLRQRNFMSMMIVLYGVFPERTSSAKPNP